MDTRSGILLTQRYGCQINGGVESTAVGFVGFLCLDQATRCLEIDGFDYEFVRLNLNGS